MGLETTISFGQTLIQPVYKNHTLVSEIMESYALISL